MKAKTLITCLLALTGTAPAAQGPAGASGACHHILGPVDAGGNSIGFSCADIGGNALLVWNAAQISSNITVTGGIRAVNFYPGSMGVSGTFKSDGQLAFVANGITVSGSITGSSVLIAGGGSTVNDVKTNLLGPGGRMTISTAAIVNNDATGTITATTGNIVMAGNTVINNGQLTAKKGNVILTVGTTLDVGWNDVSWIDGIKAVGSTSHSIANFGDVTAKNITLEAHRAIGVNAVRNEGNLRASDSVTVVTGSPGSPPLTGTFGIRNFGTIYATKITINPYSASAPNGSPVERTFVMKKTADRQQVTADIGGQVSDYQTDNTPTSTIAPAINAGNALTVTGNLVIPQLSASMTHLNATSDKVKPTLAMVKSTEQVRGEGAKPGTPKAKPRTKAKPVLVRGAFFDSKISAVVTSNP